MTIEEIKSNWTKTDNLIYGDNAFEVKLKSLEVFKQIPQQTRIEDANLLLNKIEDYE